jgi:hypothetical protein
LGSQAGTHRIICGGRTMAKKKAKKAAPKKAAGKKAAPKKAAKKK